MENRFQNRDFGERLRLLYDAHGINVETRGWSKSVAKDFFESGIIAFKDTGSGRGVQTNQIRQIVNVATQLTRHICLTSVEQINTVWVTRYCKYFQCSAAFLFGEITLPTPEQTDICAATGLNPSAVQLLLQDHRDVQDRLTLRNESSLSIRGYNADLQDFQSLAQVINFLLADGRADRGSGGLIDLLRAYFVTDDKDVIEGLADGVSTVGRRGFHLSSGQVLSGMLFTRITQVLVEYRADIQQKKKKKKTP